MRPPATKNRCQATAPCSLKKFNISPVVRGEIMQEGAHGYHGGAGQRGGQGAPARCHLCHYTILITMFFQSHPVPPFLHFVHNYFDCGIVSLQTKPPGTRPKTSPRTRPKTSPRLSTKPATASVHS